MIETLGVGERRSVHLVHSPDLSEWPKDLRLRGGSFVLWLGMDSEGLDTAAISRFADRCLDAGMAYLCSWGPGCKRLHDIFDEVIVRRTPDETASNVILTTWHDEELPDEGLWFFANTAWPSPDRQLSTEDWCAVVVGDSGIDAIVRRWFEKARLDCDAGW